MEKRKTTVPMVTEYLCLVGQDLSLVLTQPSLLRALCTQGHKYFCVCVCASVRVHALGLELGPKADKRGLR